MWCMYVCCIIYYTFNKDYIILIIIIIIIVGIRRNINIRCLHLRISSCSNRAGGKKICDNMNVVHTKNAKACTVHTHTPTYVIFKYVVRLTYLWYSIFAYNTHLCIQRFEIRPRFEMCMTKHKTHVISPNVCATRAPERYSFCRVKNLTAILFSFHSTTDTKKTWIQNVNRISNVYMLLMRPRTHTHTLTHMHIFHTERTDSSTAAAQLKFKRRKWNGKTNEVRKFYLVQLMYT